MADLTINLYLAPRATYPHPIPVLGTVTANVLQEYVFGAEWFDEVIHEERALALCCVHASDATHTAIQADARVTRIIPALSVTAEQIKARLDSPLSDLYTTPQLVAFRDKLATLGFDVDDLTLSSTPRDVMQRLIDHVFVSQRYKDAPLRDMFSLSLTATVGSISAARRNAIKAWMTAHGIDSSWITLTTTIREVVRYVVQHIPSLPHRFGRLP